MPQYLLFVPGRGEPKIVMEDGNRAMIVAKQIANKEQRLCYILEIQGRAMPTYPPIFTAADTQADFRKHQ